MGAYFREGLSEVVMPKLVGEESVEVDDAPGRRDICVKVLRQDGGGCLPETKAVWPRPGRERSTDGMSAVTGWDRAFRATVRCLGFMLSHGKP